MKRNAYDPFVIAHHDVPGKHRNSTASNRLVNRYGVVLGQIGGCTGPCVICRHIQLCYLGRVAKTAICNYSIAAAHLEPRGQDAPRRGGRCILA